MLRRPLTEIHLGQADIVELDAELEQQWNRKYQLQAPDKFEEMAREKSSQTFFDGEDVTQKPRNKKSIQDAIGFTKAHQLSSSQ